MAGIDGEVVYRIGEIFGLLFAGALSAFLAYKINPKNIAATRLDKKDEHRIYRASALLIDEPERLIKILDRSEQHLGTIANGVKKLADERQANIEHSLSAIYDHLKKNDGL